MMSSQRRCLRYIHNISNRCQLINTYHKSQYLIPSHSIFSSIQPPNPSHDITQIAYRHFQEKLKSQTQPKPSTNPIKDTSSTHNIPSEIPIESNKDSSTDTDTTQVTIQHIEDHLTVIQYNDKKIFLLGIIHSSLTSAQQVSEVIEEVQPDTIVLEICPERAAYLLGEIQHWKKKIKSGHKVTKHDQKQLLLGGEFRTAINEGKRIGAKMIYADMDQRLLSEKFKFGLDKALSNPSLSISDKLKLRAGVTTWRDFMELRAQWFGRDPEILHSKMRNREAMKEKNAYMVEKAPALQLGVVEERNDKLSVAIRDCEGDMVVAIVGFGHMEGIEERFRKKFEGIEDRVAKKELESMMNDVGVERLKNLGGKNEWHEKEEFKFLKNARDLPQKFYTSM